MMKTMGYRIKLEKAIENYEKLPEHIKENHKKELGYDFLAEVKKRSKIVGTSEKIIKHIFDNNYVTWWGKIPKPNSVNMPDEVM